MSEDTFAQRLKRLREKAGLTQQQLADASGLTQGAVCDLERGRRPDPRVSTAAALAKALGVGVERLLGA